MAAWATFTDSLFDVGFGRLHVYADAEAAGVADEEALRCAGMAEGALTHERIASHFRLYKEGQVEDLGAGGDDWPAGLVRYVQQNIDYTRSSAAAKKASDEWWMHVARVLAHTDGIMEGYMRARAEGEPAVTEVDWWLLQSGGDMDDLAGFVKADGSMGATHATMPDQWHDTHHHCTASVFLKHDMGDVWFAQDTWSGYNQMNRIMKDYDFALRVQGASRRTTFSSHPGLSLSMDDFWMMDSGLLVLETTIHTWNTTLYDLHCTPRSVFCWIRVQVANKMSHDGRSWTTNFVRENSGTYNNQYFVLDLNKFTPGKKPEKDLLWAVEQLPGDYEAGDRTEELVRNHYVPGINTPAFERIYNKAGYPDKVKETQCNYWSYWNCSRMRIFQRDAPSVDSYKEFQQFMRINNWQTDPASSGDPAQSILSRYDLRPDECLHQGTMTMCPNAFGGTDSKTTNYQMGRELKFDMISSPQYEEQAAWEFGTGRWAKVKYDGLPALWKFPRVQFGPEQP
eukprot:m51a1_g2813 hypothetical protein (510) ;mRNA; r:140653-142584